MTGGHYDVDVIVKDPHGKILYDEKKKQYDSVNFDAEVLGLIPLLFYQKIAHDLAENKISYYPFYW